jgi:biofilm PGA synthesis lipoprotein PgaB
LPLHYRGWNLSEHQIRKTPSKLAWLWQSAFVLSLGLILPSFEVNAESQGVILQYHFISTKTPPVTSTSPVDFRRHMDYMADNGFTIMPLEELIERVRSGEAVPDFSAAISFDDGYLSVYTEAFPILKQRNWPFTVFVTTGLLGSNPELYASWDQIREMAAAGATIANHTITHPYFLEQLDDETESQWRERIRDEILMAEEQILQQTGQSHQLLAYPYGEFDPEIQRLVNEMGFVGIAQHSGPFNSSSDYTALPRFPFSGIYVSMNTFPSKVRSLAFTLDGISPLSPLTRESSPSAILDFSNGSRGLSQLACYNNNESIQVEADNAAEAIFRVSTSVENRSRRFRYNCTAPGENGRYYWYSIPWINPAIAE